LLDLKQLSAFYYVAKTGSFNLAEQKVGVKQSWLSRQITELEEQCGSKLLERHHGSVILTPEGEALFGPVEKLLFDAKIIESSITENRDEPKGKLTIATTVGHTPWLVHYLPEFMNRYEDMRICIVGNDENLNIMAQNADVAIKPFIPKTSEYVHLYLLSYPLGLFASAEYLKQYGVPQAPEDLNHHRLIAFSKDKKIPFGNVDWHLSLGCKKGEHREPYLQVNSALGLSRAAQYGLGIVSISKYQEVSKGAKLVPVLPEIEGPVVDVFYVYPKRLENVKRITLFGEYLVEKLKEESQDLKTNVLRRELS
jgi:DNA-binding transcriptional LysR family regulator